MVKSIKSYLKEFCTIRVCSARQAGHTTAIIDLIIKRFRFQKTCVFFPHRNMVNLFDKKRDLSFTANKLEKFSVHTRSYSIDNYASQYLKDCDTIFVDCSSFISKHKQEALYDEIANSLKDGITKPIYIIFMQ